MKNGEEIMKKTAILLIIIVLMSIFIPNSAFSSPDSEKKVVMFIVDNINYKDLVDYGGENIKFLLKNSALGLMNTNTGSSYLYSHAYATMGAGSYAVSSAFGSYSGGYDDVFFQEPFHVIYKRNTGIDMEKDNVVNIDIAGLKRNNERLNRPVKIGMLGSLLHEHGLKTAIIGNESTSFDEICVNAALITMDFDGKTDLGKVDDSILTRDPIAPFGLRTDYDAMYNTYMDLKDRSDFIVIQSGDTHRLNKYTHLSEEAYKQYKIKQFKAIDEFLGEILETLDKDSLLIFSVPFPSNEDVSAGKRLTPIITYGKSAPKGLLTSSTTKRDGIITNTDIAAQVLSFFGIETESPMTGHVFKYKDIQDPLNYIMELNSISVFNYNSRGVVVKTFIICIVAILLISIIIMIYFREFAVYTKPCLIAILITPTILLMLPLFKPWTSLRLSVTIIGLTLLLSLLLTYIFQEKLSLFTISCLFSTGLIIIDTFLKNPLMKVSILGYDPIAGARFYGIGNEYMGFLLGTTIIGTTALIDKYKGNEKLTKVISIILYGLVLFILATPTLGTNVGGSIAGFVGFLCVVLLLVKGKISFRDLSIIGILLIIFLLCLFIYDGMRPRETQSHIGQTSLLVKEGSIGALFQIFGRKLKMNYKLMRYSNWTWVLFATIGALAALFRWPVGILKDIFKEYKNLYFGFVSGIIGTISAFIFNDSGVVAAAMSMIPITIPLIILCIDKLSQKDS